MNNATNSQPGRPVAFMWGRPIHGQHLSFILPALLLFSWLAVCSFCSLFAIDYPLVIPAGHPSQTSDALEFLSWGALGLLPVAVVAGILARDKKTMAMSFGTGAFISSGMGLLFDAFMIIESNSSGNKAHGYAFAPPPLWVPILQWMAAWGIALVVGATMGAAFRIVRRNVQRQES